MQYNDLIKENKIYINEILTQFNSLLLWKKNHICDTIEKLIKENSIEKKDFFKFIRICTIGKEKSPPIADTLEAIGKKEVINRIKMIEHKY
jgi:glutamyl/glutaminyl-tRNA synthetase